MCGFGGGFPYETSASTASVFVVLCGMGMAPFQHGGRPIHAAPRRGETHTVVARMHVETHAVEARMRGIRAGVCCHGDAHRT